jgi:hypothetical protein
LLKVETRLGAVDKVVQKTNAELAFPAHAMRGRP